MDVVANGHSGLTEPRLRFTHPKQTVMPTFLPLDCLFWRSKVTLKLKEPEVEPSLPMQLVVADEAHPPEVDGLAKDAEMPLEELMRRYGYVGVNEVQTGLCRD
ncbi:hypothetical protein RhiJN_12298 [Ceratobasidium sp. AG-Ba]|nr:hypothetical protein RhiJN_12298 [Ceratobasidium sp. AG-Ba]